MRRVHWSPRIQIVLAVILALIVAFNPPGSELALAAGNDNNVFWDGAGHLPGNNICGDANFPYRAPLNPRANQAVTLRARSYQTDLTGITIWYTTNSAAAVQGDWNSVPASWAANWGSCSGLGDMDIWAGNIPAQTTQVWYKIAYTDGTDTDWYRSSGEGAASMTDDDGGWTTGSTSLTYSPPSTVYVDDDFTSATPGWDYDHFATIQDGVNAVAAGGTVNVAAGTYVENVNVSKGVILQGDTAPTSATPVVIEGRITVSADDVTVQQFKVTPGTPTGPAAAIQVSASSATIAHNVITDMSGFVVGTIKGIWVYNAASTPITNISLTENAISGITNTGSGADGIMIQGVVAGVSVYRNTISGITAGGWAYGIEVTPTDVDPWTSPADINIQENVLSTINNVPYEEEEPHLPYPGAGVIIGAAGTLADPHPANASEAVVFDNSFSDIPIPVLNLDVAHVLNASGNYLGLDPAVLRQAILTQDPTNGALLLNALDYTPWLDSGTEVDGATPGFQGDFSTLWVTANDGQTGTVGRIQEGINLATGSAPTVNVLAGTYDENVVVNKAVTLTGAAGAIIDGGGSGDVVSITANNVTLEGFTIQNSGANATDGGVKLTSVTGCTVEGNTVTDNANGILVVLASDNFITDNNINTNDYYGIAMVAGTGNTINLNNVTGNGLDAIALDNASAVGGPVTTGSTGNSILGNTITSNRDGIFLGENCDGNTVDENTLSNIASIGVSAWRSDGHTITDNTISDAATGIRLLGSSNNTITGNTLSGSTVGVQVDASWQDGVWYQSTNNAVHQNNLAGTASFAVDCGDEQTAQVNASLNWWGATSGPAAGQISGNVLYCPWLDGVPGTGEPRSGVVTNANTTETFCSIQAAIDDAETLGTHTINVSAGTYVENVNVHKGVILQGDTAPTSATPVVIEGRITVSADDVTVQQFKVTPGTPTGPAAAIQVSASSATIAHNVITDMSGFVVGTIKGIWVYNAASTPIANINLTENAISGITNTGSGADGIMIQGVVAGVSVYRNTISGITAGGWAYGIEVTPTDVDPWTSPADIDIQENVLSTINNVPYVADPPHLPYPGTGVIIGAAGTLADPHPANASEAVVFDNSFSDIPIPVLNLDVAHVLNASGNYLGLDPAVLRQAILTQDPANGALLLNALDYTPWLDSGTEVDGATPGFQGDFSTLRVTANDGQTGTVGRIQEGIDLATGSAPMVNVLAGTYNEATTLDKAGLLVVSQGAVTLSGASLTLTEGLWVLGAHNLSLASGVTVSGGSSAAMVVADSAGALCRAYSEPGAFTFPIGDRTGDTEYSPAALDFTAGTFSSGQACVRVTDAAHPGNMSSPTAYITRYWTVTAEGISSFTANATFTYLDADIVGTETTMYALKVDGIIWLSGDQVNAAANTFAMDVTGFSDFTAGNSPTAVVLASFNAVPQNGAVLVSWETATEIQNLGFNLYQGTSAAGPWVQLNAELVPAQTPGGVSGAAYEWLDTGVTPGVTVYYRLEDVDIHGASTFHGPVSATPTEPSAVHLVAFSAQDPVAGRVLALLVALGSLSLWRKRNW